MIESSNSRSHRSSMPVSRKVSSIPQRRICKVRLNTLCHFVFPCGSACLFFQSPHSDSNSRIPVSLPNDRNTRPFTGLSVFSPFLLFSKKIFICFDIIDIPLAKPFQSNGFHGLPEFVEMACDFDDQNRLRLQPRHSTTHIRLVAIKILL